MAAESNRDLLGRFYAAMDKNEVGATPEFWTEEMVWRGPAGLGTHQGAENFEKNIREPFIAAFPDKVAHDEVRLFDGDYIASTGHQDAAFAEDWLGIPATGDKVRVRYMDVWRVENGKLAENWVLIDILGVLEQAGYDVKKVLAFVGSKDSAFFETLEADKEA